MAGVILETRVQAEAAIRAFAQLRLVVADTGPVMRAIGVGLADNVRDRFQRGSGPGGEAWAPLNPLYAADKRGPGILRESGMRGGLMGSITSRAGSDSVEVGTKKIYKVRALLTAIVISTIMTPYTARAGDAVGVRQIVAPSRERGIDLDVTVWYPAQPGGAPTMLGDSVFFIGIPAQRDAPIAAGKFPLILLSHGAAWPEIRRP